MTNAIDKRKTGCTCPRGIVLGRPGIRHRNPQIEAKEGNNGSNSGKRKVAGCKQRDQHATDESEYSSDRQPEFALQALTEEIGKDGGSDESKGAKCGNHTSLSCD